jgi:methylated-DNA-[protein]-cysteine S-methyltransferase
MVSGEKGIKYLLLPGWSKEKIIDHISDEFAGIKPGSTAPREINEAIDYVRRYFLGREGKLEPRLDLSGLTEFQRRVLDVLCTVESGQTRTYSWVAEKVGNRKGIRAVAQAIAHNPIPLFIPCHRIIGKDGSMTGFSSPGGIRMKRYMLDLEQRTAQARG